MPSIAEYYHSLLDPYIFYDDERLYLPPFHKYLPNQVPSDYIKDYYLQAIMPWGFQALMKFGYSHVDILIWNSLIRLAVTFAIIIAIGLIAWELGGAVGCFSTIAIFFVSPMIPFYTLGGVTPRIIAHAAPFFAVLCIMKKQPYLLSLITILASLIYPQAAFITGLMLALWFLYPVKNILNVNYSFKKKITFLTGTAIICIIPVFSQIFSIHDYGRRMLPSDIGQYPEIGPNGRYFPGDSYPYNFFFFDFLSTFARTIATPSANSIFMVITYIALIALIASTIRRIYASNPKIYAILIMQCGGFVAYIASYILAPYLYIPARYIQYTLPNFIILMIAPAFLVFLKQIMPGKEKIASILSAVFIVMVILCFYSGAFLSNRMNIPISEEDKKLYEFLKTLPEDSNIAGWPTGYADNIPLLSHRNVFINYKNHQVFFHGYIEEMRERFRAVLDVYYAASKQEIINFKDKYKVTHIIIEKPYLTGNDKPIYFKPFNKEIEAKLLDSGKKPLFFLGDDAEKAVVYRNGGIVVYDLNILSNENN